MVNVSDGDADALPERQVCAVSLILRDMGNGVTRVLHAVAVCGIPPKEFFEVFRPTLVPIPLADRVADALACAAEPLGIDPARVWVGGFMRAITDDITDLFIW